MGMNTHHKVILHFLIFKEPDEDVYTGVCYELSLVLTNKDPDKLREEISKTAQNYVETVVERELSTNLLNQQKKLPKPYRDLFRAFDVDERKSKREASRLSELIDNVIDAQAFAESSPIGA